VKLQWSPMHFLSSNTATTCSLKSFRIAFFVQGE
jgi:hypothetical protein